MAEHALWQEEERSEPTFDDLPGFFKHAQKVLGLTDQQTLELWQAHEGTGRKHNHRVQEHGDPEDGSGLPWDTTPKWKGVTCKWEGCEREAKALGLCPSHHHNAKYSKDHEWLIPAHRMPRCRVKGCDHPMYSKKERLCRNCQGKFERGTLHKKAEERREEMEEPGDLNTVGGRIKQARQERGWSREQLAEKTGRRERTIKRLEQDENGRVAAKQLSGLKVYADAFGKKVSELIPPDMLPDTDTMSGLVKFHRIERGWTLEDLGDRVGFTRERVRQIEESKALTYQMAERFAKVFGLEPDAATPRRELPPGG